ncbi:MAG TPA: hypothetical protein VG651_11620 [Stellaceae bacterium]|nr:hypothetical protein [Stellaceae bacterium]
MLWKPASLGAVAIAAAAAFALPYPAAAQVAPPPGNAVTLPPVTVLRPRAPNPNPHHYQVPAGYDSDTALHPYTSGIGPCPEGAEPETGCWRPTRRIMPSHYERPPFNQP